MLKTANPNEGIDFQDEKEVEIRKVKLDGISTLRAEKVTLTFETTIVIHRQTKQPIRILSKKFLREDVEPLELALVEVTKEELLDYRRNKIPSFVLKIEDKLYYSRVPAEMSLQSARLFGSHKCARLSEECNRFSALPDEQGGCAKIRDCACGIERYPWIVKGYETFYTKHESFVVVECNNYEKI